MVSNLEGRCWPHRVTAPSHTSGNHIWRRRQFQPLAVPSSSELDGTQVHPGKAGCTPHVARRERRGTSRNDPANQRLHSPRWCAAGLLPTGADLMDGGTPPPVEAIYRRHPNPSRVPKVPIARGTEPGTVVLAARARSSGNTVLPLSAGQRLILRWKSGWPSISDTIGGTPMLVHNGRNVAPGYKAGDSYFFNYNPRTAVGSPMAARITALHDMPGICRHGRRKAGWLVAWHAVFRPRPSVHPSGCGRGAEPGRRGKHRGVAPGPPTGLL